MLTGPKELRYYKTRSGRVPAEEWLYSLREIQARTVIQNRLECFAEGNPGQWRALGSGVFELKISFGPGYRIYFGEDGATRIILLWGGDKGSQHQDIQKVHAFWKDYQGRTYGSQR